MDQVENHSHAYEHQSDTRTHSVTDYQTVGCTATGGVIGAANSVYEQAQSIDMLAMITWTNLMETVLFSGCGALAAWIFTECAKWVKKKIFK